MSRQTSSLSVPLLLRSPSLDVRLCLSYCDSCNNIAVLFADSSIALECSVILVLIFSVIILVIIIIVSIISIVYYAHRQQTTKIKHTK